MESNSADRLRTAVRVLAVLSALLLVLAILEGFALRRARAELQRLRSERPQSLVSLSTGPH